MSRQLTNDVVHSSLCSLVAGNHNCIRHSISLNACSDAPPTETSRMVFVVPQCSWSGFNQINVIKYNEIDVKRLSC